MQADNKLLGANGCQFISGTAEVTGKWFYLIPNEDTVFSGISEERDGSDTSVLAEIGLSGETVGKGIPITPRKTFSKIQLTSGSVVAYRDTTG